uniref:hypothetical protein n=1 Tax=Bacillus subtilis TaxID=1423 RepID=UPI002D772C5D|nr:hypothetical protein [Bacillus subtilis]WRS94205.1 hypothetical protein VDS57_02040 [Bacillus subtilis]
MADKTIKPTPIQRNSLDVATELTQLHLEQFSVADEKEIADLYARYYTLAATLKNKSYVELLDFLPEEIRSKITRR